MVLRGDWPKGVTRWGRFPSFLDDVLGVSVSAVCAANQLPCQVPRRRWQLPFGAARLAWSSLVAGSGGLPEAFPALASPHVIYVVLT